MGINDAAAISGPLLTGAFHAMIAEAEAFFGNASLVGYLLEKLIHNQPPMGEGGLPAGLNHAEMACALLVLALGPKTDSAALAAIGWDS